MSESNQLVVIEKAKSREVFQTPGAIQSIIDEVRTKALLEAPEISTAKGRQAIASAAYKVAQTKTYIDKVGKEITDELKAIPKIVDENRRIAREQLDQLKDEIRKPLTEWEEEQARIEAEKKAAEEAVKLAEQIERDHELALLMNAEFDRKREEEARQAEEARKAREDEIARQAAEQARIEAENKAKAEREAADRAVLEAKLAQERAEREKAEAEARAIREKQEAEARVKAELEAQEKRLREEQAEKERAEAEAKAKREAEEAKAAADKKHRAIVNSAIVSSLVYECGLSEDDAKKVVIASAKGKLGKLVIDYWVAV